MMSFLLFLDNLFNHNTFYLILKKLKSKTVGKLVKVGTKRCLNVAKR